jgi:hypothetical protein
VADYNKKKKMSRTGGYQKTPIYVIISLDRSRNSLSSKQEDKTGLKGKSAES